jgi:hypothetical protein
MNSNNSGTESYSSFSVLPEPEGEGRGVMTRCKNREKINLFRDNIKH